MDIKDMREALAGVVDVVPRSNEDAEKLYREKFADPVPHGTEVEIESDEDDGVKDGPVYTYIGSGDEPPQMINYMGRQVFMRGKAVCVTDEKILGKIDGNRCFVKGEVTTESLYEADQKAAKRVAKIRDEDSKMQADVMRKNRG